MNPEDYGGIRYEPHIGDGYIGYKVTHPSGDVGYVTLCPSTNEDPAMADVFVYNGPTGEPGQDDSEFYVIPFGTERHVDISCEACGAEIGEECRPNCIGEAKHLESKFDRATISKILNTVWAEIRTNANSSDVHTLEDIAADVVQRLQHEFLTPKEV